MGLKFLYLVLVFISSVEFLIYYEFTLNKTNKNFIVLYITTLVANFGYAQSIYSTTLEGAFAGMLVSYIGSIFTALFVMIVVVYLCNRRFLLPLRIFLILCAFAIIICIGTTIETNLFFSNQKRCMGRMTGGLETALGCLRLKRDGGLRGTFLRLRLQGPGSVN